MGHRYWGHPFSSCPALSQRMQRREESLTTTVGILGKSGQSSREWFLKQQIKQGRMVTGSLGEVRGVSSCCFPLFSILTGSIGDGEADGVTYPVIELFSSSEDEEEGGGEGEEDGGVRSSSLSRLWQTSAQSCCTRYSAMITRGIT